MKKNNLPYPILLTVQNFQVLKFKSQKYITTRQYVMENKKVLWVIFYICPQKHRQ